MLSLSTLQTEASLFVLYSVYSTEPAPEHINNVADTLGYNLVLLGYALFLPYRSVSVQHASELVQSRNQQAVDSFFQNTMKGVPECMYGSDCPCPLQLNKFTNSVWWHYLCLYVPITHMCTQILHPFLMLSCPCFLYKTHTHTHRLAHTHISVADIFSILAATIPLYQMCMWVDWPSSWVGGEGANWQEMASEQITIQSKNCLESLSAELKAFLWKSVSTRISMQKKWYKISTVWMWTEAGFRGMEVVYTWHWYVTGDIN